MAGKIIQVSGGLDSAAAAILTKRLYRETLYGHFVDYGQAYAAQEERAARYVCEALGLQWLKTTVNLPQQMAEQVVPEYVPIRNAVLGMLSASYAAARGASAVVVGNKTVAYRPEDPYSFRDCTVAFYEQMSRAVMEGSETGRGAVFTMPLAGRTKKEVIEIVTGGGLDMARLWWCYVAGDTPCGACEHCRQVAEHAGVRGVEGGQ